MVLTTVYVTSLQLPAHQIRSPAPQIRSTILALYKLVFMYVCMYVPIYRTLIGNSVLQVEPTDQRGRRPMAIRSGQNSLEPEKFTSYIHISKTKRDGAMVATKRE